MQPNGSLKATNFFSMYDDGTVDSHDWDLAGAPVILPAQFGTHKYPHLLVTTGKEGIVYLLDADSLGGSREGPGKRDSVLGEYGPNGASDSTAGVWPGNGGYVYVSTWSGPKNGPGEVDVYKYELTSKGVPALKLVGTTGSSVVFGVSGPLVTSNGTASGSAIVWFMNGPSLYAYSPVPVNGKLPLLEVVVRRGQRLVHSTGNRQQHGVRGKSKRHGAGLRQDHSGGPCHPPGSSLSGQTSVVCG